MNILEEMAPYLPKKTIKHRQVLIDKAEEHQLKSIMDWLQGLYDSEYAEVKRIVNLLPKETWDNYKLLGIVGLAEQILLEIALAKLKKAWIETYPHKKREPETCST